MITPIASPWESDLWQSELKLAIRSSRSLLKTAGLACDSAYRPDDFPVLVPRGFAAKIRSGDAEDPILKQVLATPEEAEEAAGFIRDPLNETTDTFNPTPALLKKYAHRALLVTTPACAINCRYCFRRHFPYDQHRPAVAKDVIEAIIKDTTLTEIILSGGDPMLLSDAALAKLYGQLAAVGHLKRIRIHSRLPIVLPQRMTTELLATFKNSHLPTIMVVHANHANELDANTHRAFNVLKAAGVTLLNQSVLLKGVNDHASVQCTLAEKLFDQGVLPYYLHMPDKVAGTHHFFVADRQATEIYQDMQASLPGYLLPKMVREVPGKAAKTQLISITHEA